MKHSAKILVMLMTGVLAFSGCAANETDTSDVKNLSVTKTTEKEME